MAKQLNASKHYGYTMNWIAVVYGACISDYARDGQDLPRTNEILEESLRTRPHRLLSRPNFDTPLNLAGYTLAHQMKDFWLDHFASDTARIGANKIFGSKPAVSQ